MAALGLGVQVGIALPYGRAQESEADRLGLDLMARAGFNPAEAIPLWQNMSAAAGARRRPSCSLLTRAMRTALPSCRPNRLRQSPCIGRPVPLG